MLWFSLSADGGAVCVIWALSARRILTSFISVRLPGRSIATQSRIKAIALLLFFFFRVFNENRKIKRQLAQRRHAFAINFNICKLNKCVLIKSILFLCPPFRFFSPYSMKNVLPTCIDGKYRWSRRVCVCRENRTIVTIEKTYLDIVRKPVGWSTSTHVGHNTPP